MTTGKRHIEVDGARLAFVEAGAGDPIIFLHGNPTSSYLWRNVIPYLSPLGRCIAPDLVGMGDSDKLPNSGPDRYTLAEHYHYLSGLLAALGVERRVTLVVHDWGGPLGFRWAREHPQAVRGIAYMETLVMPVSWDDWPDAARGIFQGFRSERGESLVLERNSFVERVLPNSILRQLDEEEMAEYRRPFARAGEDRRPTLSWPRQIPVDGEPADVVEVVQANYEWLKSTPIPKLLVAAEPGSIMTGRVLAACREFPAQTEVTVPGLHFIQEDSPDLIGAALRDWFSKLP